VAQEFFFQLGRVIHIKQDLILVLKIPFVVLLDICNVVWIHEAKEVEPILANLGRIVWELWPSDLALRALD